MRSGKTERKITLGHVRRCGDDMLLIYCMNHAVQYGGCFHNGSMPLWRALQLWGEDRRLDELPFRCSRCGSRKHDVRADQPYRPGNSGKLTSEALDRHRRGGGHSS